MSFKSALYIGPVVHERIRPKFHRLRYSVFSLLLDLNELEKLDASFTLFGYNRKSALAFFDQDHGPASGEPLRPWVEHQLSKASIKIDGGPIRLLCYPRIFGYVFNPLSVYFVYRKTGELSAILYEVCNTFKERHTYIIPVMNPSSPVIKQQCAKKLYVSPFIDMDAQYDFRILPPGKTLSVTIQQADKDGPLLTATFKGTRKAMTQATLCRALFAIPLMTIKIFVGIHWEAVWLYLKGVPVFPHNPAPHAVDTSVVKPEALGK